MNREYNPATVLMVVIGLLMVGYVVDFMTGTSFGDKATAIVADKEVVVRVDTDDDGDTSVTSRYYIYFNSEYGECDVAVTSWRYSKVSVGDRVRLNGRRGGVTGWLYCTGFD